jgi:hypothetical protein
LVVADKRLGCVAYAEDEDFSNDAVISVVYANGPSVIDKMGGLLLEEHKTGVIEARGGRFRQRSRAQSSKMGAAMSLRAL